ncbi:MAG: N-acetyltransferase [Opitutaceae bacterium]|nr:N-acetyltransferase [Opitutaceae bacterium]
MSMPAVHHDAAARRYASGEGEHLAVLEYERAGDRMTYTHTFVPPELRGRGLAEALVRAALADAKSAGLKVVPQCSYVAKFIERHAEYQPLLAP